MGKGISLPFWLPSGRKVFVGTIVSVYYWEKSKSINLYCELPEQRKQIFPFIEPWETCLSSPCHISATCLDVNVDTFVCICADSYFGVTCSNSMYLKLIEVLVADFAV